MNMNQMINMFTRLLMRRAMNWGITKGIATMSRKPGPDAEPQPDGADRKQRKQAGDMAKRVRMANRMTRR